MWFVLVAACSVVGFGSLVLVDVMMGITSIAWHGLVWYGMVWGWCSERCITYRHGYWFYAIDEVHETP